MMAYSISTHSKFASKVYKKKKYVLKHSEAISDSDTPKNCKHMVVVLTKTYHSFRKRLFNIMSTHWKQNKCIIICTTCILLVFGLVMFLYTPMGKPRTQPSFSYVHDNFERILENKTLNNTGWIIPDDIETNNDEVNSNMENLTTDFVKPIKVHHFPLNSDDLLYESKRNNSKNDYFSAYSVTGNYRSKSNQIWDPHPEYTLNVFGNHLHLILHQDNSFIEPNTFRVIRILNNKTEVQDDEDYYLGCYYKGYVEGDNQSTVAVSLCNGMTGHIKTSFGTLLIQPVYNSTNCDDNNLVHKVWRHSKRHVRFLVPDNIYSNVNYKEPKLFSKLVRKKRNFVDKQLFTMEVLVAVDKSMSEFHKADLNSYILTLISVVSNIFSDASIGNSINISVPNILLLKDDIKTSRGKKTTSASQLLKQFCTFLHNKRIHYDTAIMLTRDQICRNEGETKCDTLGLAELGTVCKSYSCSIVQDNGLPAAFTIAHELGHILNMPHDDDSRCLDFKRYGKSTLHIMSSTMGDNIHPWSWSDCSRHYVSEFLEKEDTTCLEDTPRGSVPKFNTKLPGELYTLDEQCRLIHGNYSKYCSVEGDCKKLWCKEEEQFFSCRSSNLPWADGTPCGNHNNWCQKGKCVPREGTNRQAINGGWGPWSTFTACSMTCGGGVQESQRECNNPFPENGGKYCGGSRKKFRSCNTQNCPPGSLDPREQQCYDMNGNNFGLKGIDSSVRWIPKYGLISKDKCKLYCRWDNTTAYFQLSEKVKDGTTCSFDSFDKCVNGICRPAGCDNELNSVATLDKCGVCEGRNNTCEEYSGNFYKSDLSNKNNSMYYYVTTIPKGSSNIVITQPGYHTQNYIVLHSSDNKSLLNGDRVINVYKYVFFYAGVPFEYNGSNNVVEKVNTTYSRKLKKDLIVEIISLNIESMKNDAILLSYSYTAEKRYKIEPYQWEMKDWSSCDALCQGSSFQSAECINTMSGLRVASPFCDSSKKPRTKYRPCNTDCYVTLNISSISACSASCGMPGRRNKTYNCIQTYIETNVSQVVELSFCEPRYEINFYEDCREGCWDYSNWSPCSQSCGDGQQIRSVACFFNGTQVENSLCDMNKRSGYNARIRSCNLGECSVSPIYEEDRKKLHWITDCDDNCEKSRVVSCSNGNRCSIEKKKCCVIKYVRTWSPCSVECGVGTKRKEFYCAKVFKSEKKGSRQKREKIDPKYCSGLRIPTPKLLEKSCKMTCKWTPNAWSTCPSDCSTEYQTRQVNCTNMIGRQISSRYCDSTKKPTARQMCSHCVRRDYKITKCNCEGYRKRRVVCSDTYGKIIQCPNKQKILREKCRPPEECFPKSCADIKRSHKILYDREYTIFIKQKPMKIYCHKMNAKPKEYITLNPSENYSIYYDNKTKYPDMCPPESRNYEYKDYSIKFGRTHFHKVAIDIASLRVIENDFTFADTVGTQQPLGSAGDCYNRNGECPQGDFSINFSTTGFFISSKTRWDIFGNRAVIKTPNDFNLSNTNRRAFCGGYCGRCAISARSGLVLDV